MDNSLANINTGSMVNASKEQKKAIFNLLNNAQEKISDHINETIRVKFFAITNSQVTDEESGELKDTERVVLLDVNDVSYHSMASGIVSSFRNITSIFGSSDTWEEPLDVKVVKRDTRNGHTYILEVQ